MAIEKKYKQGRSCTREAVYRYSAPQRGEKKDPEAEKIVPLTGFPRWTARMSLSGALRETESALNIELSQSYFAKTGSDRAPRLTGQDAHGVSRTLPSCREKKSKQTA